MNIFKKICAFLRMVKIEHSIFALPFALSGYFIATRGRLEIRSFVLLILAMVTVRSFAMSMNRLLDLRYDRLNPRTRMRELVTGELSVQEARFFCGMTAVIFVAACAGLNPTCLLLSPLALVWSGFYSLTKRFTFLCHYVLGSVLGLAPLAGQLAARAEIDLSGILLFLGVTFWVAGFDILYASQDVDFDKSQGLHSLPAQTGVPLALKTAFASHVLTVALFLGVGLTSGLSWAFYLVWAIVSAILVYEHRFIKPDDLSRINLAFFTMNGFVAVLFFFGVLLGVYV